MILCTVTVVVAAALFLAGRKKLPKMAGKGLFILTLMAIFGIILGIEERQNPTLIDGTKIKRNEAGEGDFNEELDISVENLIEGYSYQIEVPAQALTTAEEQNYLNAAKQEIDAEFVGENESVNCMRQRVVIREDYQEGLVCAEWYFDPYDVIDSEGNIQSEKLSGQGELVEAVVYLSCGDSTSEYRFSFWVYPDLLTEQDQILQKLSIYWNWKKRKKGKRILVCPRR